MHRIDGDEHATVSRGRGALPRASAPYTLERLRGARITTLVILAPNGVPVSANGKVGGKGPRVEIPMRPGSHEVFAVVNGKMRKQKVRFPDVRFVDLRPR